MESKVTLNTFVGEWATDETKFKGGPISEGCALYIRADGVGAIIAAPPPIGRKGSATYDAKEQILRFSMTERGKPAGTFDFIYDPRTKALTSSGGEFGTKPFRRRRDQIPQWVVEELR